MTCHTCGIEDLVLGRYVKLRLMDPDSDHAPRRRENSQLWAFYHWALRPKSFLICDSCYQRLDAALPNPVEIAGSHWKLCRSSARERAPLLSERRYEELLDRMLAVRGEDDESENYATEFTRTGGPSFIGRKF